MKQLVKQLTTKLLEKELSLDITGEKLMKELNITRNNLNNIAQENHFEPYDYYQIDCSTNYFNYLTNQFTFDNGITFYKDNAVLSSTIKPVLDAGANWMVADLFDIKTFDYYSDSLINIINKLILVSTNEPINLSLQYLGSYYINFTIQNKDVIEVKFDEDQIEYNEHNKTTLLYQLIIISYNVPLNKTLTLLNLI